MVDKYSDEYIRDYLRDDNIDMEKFVIVKKNIEEYGIKILRDINELASGYKIENILRLLRVLIPQLYEYYPYEYVMYNIYVACMGVDYEKIFVFLIHTAQYNKKFNRMGKTLLDNFIESYKRPWVSYGNHDLNNSYTNYKILLKKKIEHSMRAELLYNGKYDNVNIVYRCRVERRIGTLNLFPRDLLYIIMDYVACDIECS